MQELNKEQQQAVKTTEGFVRVISGAGSGKTRIITNRYVYLVNELGVANGNILCTTFTNNAAKEMKQRIDKMVKHKDVGYICTFHRLSAKALREDIHCVDIVPNFTIMDTEDQNSIFKKIYKKLGITNREYHYETMKENITMIKSMQESITNNDKTINYIECLAENSNKKPFNEPFLEKEQQFFNEYIEEQRKTSMLDFNDLINIFLYILVNYKDKRVKWQHRFQYIMCDEFNDIDYKQYQMLKILSQYHKNLMIVGDPDQTIYSWRGSNVNYIINFDKDFPNVKDIVVSTNYRSVPSVLNVANSLIKHNQNRLDKDLKPFRTGEEKVVYNVLRNQYEEAKWIVEQIKRLKDNGENLSDIAVLYRNNNLSRNIEEQLISNNIKYCVYSGIDFYSRKEIKDILSYLRFILYENDIDFERIINVPSRGIGKKTLEYISQIAKENNCSLYKAFKHCVSNEIIKKSKANEFLNVITKLQTLCDKINVLDLVNEVLQCTGYLDELNKNNEQERLENIEELKHGIIEFQKTDIEEKTLKEYLDKISLYTNNDRTSKENSVKLMTIHAAKGLEFKNVFIIRIVDGILPSGKVKTPDGLEEERRLFYVAITRAKDKLYLSDTMLDYNELDNMPSRFLKELDFDEIEFATTDAKERIVIEEKRQDNTSINTDLQFKAGDKIEHSVFGPGVIQDINFENKTYAIKFEKFDTLRTISANMKLEKIEE